MPSNKDLREFADKDDLFDNATSDQILEWVNAYAIYISNRDGYHKKYQAKRKAIEKAALKMLDADEIRAINEQAKAIAEEKMHEKELDRDLRERVARVESEGD